MRRVRSSWLIRGSSVLVRIESIIRPPLSSSVQRLTMVFTTSSSKVNGMRWLSSMRVAMRNAGCEARDASDHDVGQRVRES